MKVVITQTGQAPTVPAPVATGISAAAGGQSGATELASRVNVVTATVSGGGVRLKVVGDWRQEVLARAGASIAVYPPDGHTIAGEAENASVTLPDGDDGVFTFDGTATWYRRTATGS